MVFKASELVSTKLFLCSTDRCGAPPAVALPGLALELLVFDVNDRATSSLNHSFCNISASSSSIIMEGLDGLLKNSFGSVTRFPRYLGLVPSDCDAGTGAGAGAGAA